MKYGYARVSTIGQGRDGNSLEAQEERLKDCDRIFCDTFTGTKIKRPEFSKLLKIIKEGDTLVVTKLDRLSRSASEGIKLVNDLLNRGIIVHILNMGLMDDTPTGKVLRNVMFAFAEFERDMIVERTQEGKAVARENPDYREGRPQKVIDGELIESVKSGLMSVAEACRKAGISRSTWYKHVGRVESKGA